MVDSIGFLKSLEEEGIDFKKDLSCLKSNEQIEILNHSCKEIYPESEVFDRLANSIKNEKPLKIKYGIDPLSFKMQIGDIVPLILISKLQRMGHDIILLIGDTTAMIGDPFDSWYAKSLNRKSIEKNLKQLKKRLFNFLDFSKTTIVYNSNWLNEVKLSDLLELMVKTNVNNMLKTKKFKEKLDKGEDLSYAKLIYPFIMGMDSIELYPDVEVGKYNQIDSFYMCRYMMEVSGLKPQLIMATLPLPKEDIFCIDSNPEDIFKTITKLSKEEVIMWYKLLTEVSLKSLSQVEELIAQGKLDLQSVKEVLSKIIVCRLYNKEKSESTFMDYIKEFVKVSKTQDITMISGSVGIGDFITASTVLTFEETYGYITSGGAKILSCDGNSLINISDCDADINSIKFDKFYIILSDRLILSIKK